MPRRILSLLVTVLSAASLPAQAPAPFVSLKTPEYDIYASSQAILDASRAQLDSARTQFARYFPGSLPKLTVVVAENRATLNQFDVKGLRDKAGDVLAWTVAVTNVTPDGGIMEMKPGSAGGTDRIALFGNLSAVLAPTVGGKGSLVRFIPPSGAGAGVDLRAADVIQELNGRPMPDPAALNQAYNALAIGAEVKLRIQRGGGDVTVAFMKPAGEQRAITQNAPPGAAPRGAGMGQGSEPRILSHEAGHYLLGQWAMDRVGGRAKMNEMGQARAGLKDTSDLFVAYGSPLLPDWADEAGATISESKSFQTDRRKYIVDNFGAIIPLAKLFAAEHPALPGLKEMARATKASGAQSSGPVSFRVARGADSMDPGMFYAQSLSVIEFLAEREGTAFIPQLYDALIRGQTMEQILTSAKKLPHTVEALNTDYLKWVSR